MTTSAGYYDAQGSFIPGSFADQLDLPGPPGPADANAAQQQLAARQAAVKAETARLKAYEKAAVIKRRPGGGWVGPASKKILDARVVDAKKRLATAQANVVSAQNVYYEKSGQYDKLLQGANRDAFAALSSLFNGYGLGSLAPKIYEFAKQGYGADVISLLLQDTKEYKTRFAGNTARASAGLPVLSPAEYLSTEQAYRQILTDAGLPRGFYDSPTDFTKWIAGDNSPTEIKGRVDLAVANSMQINSYTKQALSDLYGVDQSYVTAYFLDSQRALPLLQKQSQAAQFGAEALKRGLQMNQGRLEDYVTAGLSQSAVSQGFQAVAEALPNIQAIAARYGEGFTQTELEQDFIEGGTGGSVSSPTALGEAPTNKRKRLASQERALFAGYGGGTPGGLSTGFQQT